jgi:hypothetical protein
VSERGDIRSALEAMGLEVLSQSHPQGAVLPDRGDGLHWMTCTDCDAEFAERDDGTLAAGSDLCAFWRVRPRPSTPIPGGIK